MPLTFAQAQFALAFVSQISPKRADAFEARLKQWQKMGFPEGVNVGRGVRASYGATQVHQLLFMMKLLQVGLTPERAQKVVISGWPAFKDAIVETILCRANGEDHLHYCLIQLDALSELKEDPSDHMHVFVDAFTSDEIHEAFISDQDFMEWLSDNDTVPTDATSNLRQHQYLSFLTKNRLATSISIEVDSLLVLLWTGLVAIGLTPEVFSSEIADWERERRARGRAQQETEQHFAKPLISESVADRVTNFDVSAAAWSALAMLDPASVVHREHEKP
ncbi:hypothetical protein QP175_05800 [Sphingomonas aerolata]|uniref:hypothetical protein n=1 Tax=Sphingomonas aerolata TaxID=185951 RepID=UPI002FE04E65